MADHEQPGSTGSSTNHRVRKSDLIVGRPVPYSIYDTYDRLLLRRGYVLRNESQRQLLLEVGQTPERPPEPPETEPREPTQLHAFTAERDTRPPNPFEVYRHCARALGQAFRQIGRSSAELQARLERMIARLGNIIDHDADASLAAAHFDTDLEPHVAHPIRTAILCDVVARRMELPGLRRRGLVGAALTANIGMRELQAELDQQTQPLTARQREQIRHHPQVSGELLEEHGITDPSWLSAVYQHHERVDGSGYPRGLEGDAICDEAAILMLADSYLAMVGQRAYREARDLRSALSELFQSGGALYPVAHAQALIKEVGIFPPGTPVTLDNHEQAIVIRRGPSTTQPRVCVYTTPGGRRLVRPRYRELSEDAAEITSVQTINAVRLPFSAEAIWGYSADTAPT